MPSEGATGETPVKAPRADAQRNAGLVLAGARRAVAVHGLGVSYHEIARLAGVGVGTVYRRFPQRDQLMAAVLLDILDELIDEAERALECPDPWEGFTGVFTSLALRARENAGLSGSLDEQGGPRVAAQRRRLLDLLHRITERAHRAGVLRDDVGWQDIPFLAQAATPTGCVLDVPAGPQQAQRAITVILDGLHTPT
ncbi:TetR/AcrR family transcriptional regulator [Actinoallomurus rhizosphaericola]|uniref:TetR/AcrR family transcriptional regulator n=1 Tax=Actinoallomurus rhizosphaericola TaxID=2952536 RepID=UPI00209128F0|nr:TetR/AcrR family transcriptional regulator [Actinoallomurus rhizosphaericola]MCO5994221.1 TetR/AcrR family transcriptional regulator [Actinoallomurus rhizosphaericola]